MFYVKHKFSQKLDLIQVLEPIMGFLCTFAPRMNRDAIDFQNALAETLTLAVITYILLAKK